MTLREKLNADLKEAMKARDQVRLDTIRNIKSAMKYKEVAGTEATELSDDEIVKVVTGLVKQRRESAEQFRAGNRPEMAEKEEKELAILQQYLPQQLTPDEIEAIVAAAVQEAGASSPKDMGAVMKIVQPKVAGRADGKVVSELVKKKLSGA